MTSQRPRTAVRTGQDKPGQARTWGVGIDMGHGTWDMGQGWALQVGRAGGRMQDKTRDMEYQPELMSRLVPAVAVHPK